MKRRNERAARPIGNGLRPWWLAILALGAAATSGCAGNRVGKDWQCPMVQGVPCQSVVEADPAGPGGPPAPGGQGAVAAPPGAGASSMEVRAPKGDARSGTCTGDCRPLERPRRTPGDGKTPAGGGAPTGGNTVAGGDDRVPEPESPDTQGSSEAGSPVSDREILQSLRTPEVIGRIWIAPYVDDVGIYHEGAWVRVVIEPARWKLP